MSLRSLADQTGLSATLLSQIERGVTDPSLKSLRMLAGVFGQSVATLFENSDLPPVTISRPGARSRITSPAGHVQYERIAASNGSFEVLRGVLQPGDTSSDDAWAHESLECVYVITGTLTVFVGTEQHRLAAGEAVTFDARQPHRYANDSTTDLAELLMTVSPPMP
ncbi:hypothetical protein GCM10022240_30230 [Microbacterium kribbense]|uniref:HTH cro/C1-type domain-containing protein n=1 Tax=Microbacterium kribbense TaxID=433645 RepID=A0ABP7GXQ1_9MICO